MAAMRLKYIVFVSRAGGFFLIFAALVLLCFREVLPEGNQTLFVTLPEGLSLIPWGAYVVWIQLCWLCLGGEQPDNVKLFVLIAVEWLVAWLTIGTACVALSAYLFAHYCAEDSGCVFFLVASGIACTSGALTAVSALGMLWIHGSQFHQA